MHRKSISQSICCRLKSPDYYSETCAWSTERSWNAVTFGRCVFFYAPVSASTSYGYMCDSFGQRTSEWNVSSHSTISEGLYLPRVSCIIVFILRHLAASQYSQKHMLGVQTLQYVLASRASLWMLCDRNNSFHCVNFDVDMSIYRHPKKIALIQKDFLCPW
jgi:hypothetical protein